MATYVPYLRLYKKGKPIGNSYRFGKSFRNKASATRIANKQIKSYNASKMKKEGYQVKLVGVKKLMARKKTKYTFPWG